MYDRIKCRIEQDTASVLSKEAQSSKRWSALLLTETQSCAQISDSTSPTKQVFNEREISQRRTNFPAFNAFSKSNNLARALVAKTQLAGDL